MSSEIPVRPKSVGSLNPGQIFFHEDTPYLTCDHSRQRFNTVASFFTAARLRDGQLIELHNNEIVQVPENPPTLHFPLPEDTP